MSMLSHFTCKKTCIFSKNNVRIVLLYVDENNLNNWSDLLKFLFQCCNLQQPGLYVSALHIIG